MSLTAPVSTVTNIEAAKRQLCTAIRLFFADGDAVTVHTVATAAREVLEKQCRKAGLPRMFDFVREGSPEVAEGTLWNLLNGPRNFFKHPADKPDTAIEFDDSLNDFQLLSGCQDCATLQPTQQPLEVQAFMIWFLAVEFPDAEAMAKADPVDANAAMLLQRHIDRLFPGLRTASRAEKKRFGARLVDDALAGKLIERSAPLPGDAQLSENIFVGT